MNILITGGSGFIGANLVERMHADGHSVRVLDNLSPQIHGKTPHGSPLRRKIEGKCEFVLGDVTNPAIVRKSLDGCNAVIHLAAETGTGQSMYEVARYCEVNVQGTAVLLEAIAERKTEIRRVVVASSRAVCGEGKYSLDGCSVYPIARLESDLAQGHFEPRCELTGRDLKLEATDEASPVSPNSIYGLTKYAQEQMTLLNCKAMDIGAVALRFQNVYGPGQSLSNPYTGILSIFSTRILNGNPIQIFEDGKESRDFVYIDDIVEATISALLSPDATGQVIGIGSGVATSVLEVATALRDLYASNVPIEITGAYRLGDIRHNVADLTKAHIQLGYVPKVDFQTGITAFANWVRTQAVESDRFEASMQEMRNKGLYKAR